jgi:hypothetical protein
MELTVIVRGILKKKKNRDWTPWLRSLDLCSRKLETGSWWEFLYLRGICLQMEASIVKSQILKIYSLFKRVGGRILK